MAVGEAQTEALRAFYEKYGFKGLASALKGAKSAAPATAETPAAAMPGESGDLFADHSASVVAQAAQHRTAKHAQAIPAELVKQRVVRRESRNGEGFHGGSAQAQFCFCKASVHRIQHQGGDQQY